VKKPRVLEMTGRERMWMLESTITGMLGAFVARKIIRALYRAVRKEAPASVFDPNSARFSWPDVVLWAAAAGIGLGIAKATSARIATIGWKVATGTSPRGSSTSGRDAEIGRTVPDISPDEAPSGGEAVAIHA
jgi:Protein of unknown function (DUF4235)